MNTKQMRDEVGSWIAEEELPVSPRLKVIRKSDPYYGLSEEEIRTALRQGEDATAELISNLLQIII